VTTTASATSATEDPVAAAGGKRGRSDPWKTAFFVLAVVALLAGVAWALLGSSFFVVRSVRVAASAHVSRDQVLTASGIAIGTPLVRIDTGEIARRVEKLTWVLSASVHRSWPDGVVISTVSRTPVFEARAGRGYDELDSHGVILRKLARPAPGLILLKSPPEPVSRLRGNAALLAAGTVVKELPPWLRHRVRAAEAAGAARVILILRPGLTVIWGGTGRTAAKAEELTVLLRTKATYYDAVSDDRLARRLAGA
jgi:cell division protein FtsQ